MRLRNVPSISIVNQLTDYYASCGDNQGLFWKSLINSIWRVPMLPNHPLTKRSQGLMSRFTTHCAYLVAVAEFSVGEYLN